MYIWMSFAIIILSALIHASFHLSVSILTLLSGHTLSRERSHLKLVKLSSALVLGVILSTLMLFCSIAYIFEIFYNYNLSKIISSFIVGISISTAISVWIFYYRRSPKTSGTELWIPREFANFLSNRAKKTRHSAEAFSLGISSVLSEIVFIAVPMSAATLTSSILPSAWQFVAVMVYIAIANLPLFIIYCLISGGHSLASIQIWREKNKRFLQFAAGLGLIVLAYMVFVAYIGAQT